MPRERTDLPVTERPLRLRARADLEVVPQLFGNDRFWAVKDPVALRYFHLRDEEYAVLRMLDGHASLNGIRSAFEKQFAPRRLAIGDLQAYLVQLHAQGLVVSTAAGQGGELSERGSEARRKQLWQSLGNLLAIRFRGFDPQWLLDRLYPLCRRAFTRAFLVACGLLVLAALALVLTHMEQIQRRLPDFERFFSLQNAGWLIAAVALAKVLHELGHALACRHFGGRCHEMGVLLLVFTPCLYCNVSDVWMLPNKWHRMAVGAAGVIVEVVLAALCTLLWWFTVPGPLNSLALSMVFVCSVSTLLFNGNPLLRYDGYYVLFDWLEIPNSRQQASTLVRSSLAEFFLGVEPPNPRDLPQRKRGLLVAYSVAAVAYRVFVVCAILWFVHEVLEPHRLEVAAWALGAFVLTGLLVGPLMRSTAFVREPAYRSQVDWRRFLVRGGLLAVVLVALFGIPIPSRVRGPVVLEPVGAKRVYVSVPGVLVSAAEPGTPVVAEQEIGRLDNPEVELDLLKLEAERDRLQKRLDGLRERQVSDRSASEEIPSTEEALADAVQRYEQRLQDRRKLVLRAPVDGTVIPVPVQHEPEEEQDEDLPAPEPDPLDPRNVGLRMPRGTTFCLVGDPRSLELVMIVDEADVEFVRIDQPVRTRFEELPHRVLEGTVTEVAEIDLERVPPELMRHLPTRPGPDGEPELVGTSYQVRVELEASELDLPVGAAGRGVVVAKPRSVASRLWRYARRTFRFEL